MRDPPSLAAPTYAVALPWCRGTGTLGSWPWDMACVGIGWVFLYGSMIAFVEGAGGPFAKVVLLTIAAMIAFVTGWHITSCASRPDPAG